MFFKWKLYYLILELTSLVDDERIWKLYYLWQYQNQMEIVWMKMFCLVLENCSGSMLNGVLENVLACILRIEYYVS